VPRRPATGGARPYLVAALTLLLALSASLAHAQRPVSRAAVATRALARGTVLDADDFVVRDTALSGPADTSRVVAGWVTRRAFTPGEVLRAPAVEPPTIISANQTVEVEWVDENVRLTIRGVATRNAALGDRIPIRTELGHRLDAIVVAPGRVRLD
jgi:flagella basal body P-ring formation protein FlgA